MSHFGTKNSVNCPSLSSLKISEKISKLDCAYNVHKVMDLSRGRIPLFEDNRNFLKIFTIVIFVYLKCSMSIDNSKRILRVNSVMPRGILVPLNQYGHPNI